MNARKFVELLENPQSITSVELEELSALVKTYPYFSLGHLAYLKGLKVSEDPRLSSVLPFAATHAQSVEWLYLFLNSDGKSSEADNNKFEEYSESAPESGAIAEAEVVEEAIEQAIPEELSVKEHTVEQDAGSEESDNATAISQVEEHVSANTADYTPEAEVQAASDSATEPVEASEETVETTDEIVETIQQAASEPTVGDDAEAQGDSDIFEFIEDDLKSATIPDDPIFEILDQKLYTLEEQEASLEFQNNLIDQFLTSMPRIVPKGEFPPVIEDISVKSLVDDGEIVTEMLAKIYAGQGLISKAIEVYEKLILKFPEKRAYFVAELEKLKESK